MQRFLIPLCFISVLTTSSFQKNSIPEKEVFYSFDIVTPPVKTSRKYNCRQKVLPRVLFEENALHHIDVDLQAYFDLLRENQEICIQITHYRHPDESEKIGRKRLKRFHNYLERIKFPMDRLQVNQDLHTVKCAMGQPCHAEIYFEVTSIESHCQ